MLNDNLPGQVETLYQENQVLKNEIKKLNEDLKLLYALQVAGVDNWSGYACALGLLDDF